MSLIPPLSLYIHIPWCVQKCPYCDFNSHTANQKLPQLEYVKHLLNDLDADLSFFNERIKDRELTSIFIGGGTPSLFEPQYLNLLLEQIKLRLNFSADIEITMEANPNSAEVQKFLEYVNAGINRLSIGVQSFDANKLKVLGRIHTGDEAFQAGEFAKECLKQGLKSFNLDLMYGLPNQTINEALSDLQQAIEIQPTHLSWYQLTIEPNTVFFYKPPKLPEDDLLWQIFEQGKDFLQNNGFERYEISAYALKGYQCRHNLNYWQFGDYLAIGAGAFGKITLPNKEIWRFNKVKRPKKYLLGNYLNERNLVIKSELPFEFFMNTLRLMQDVKKEDFTNFTGLELDEIANYISQAKQKNFLTENNNYWQVTAQGRLYLNELLQIFL